MLNLFYGPDQHKLADRLLENMGARPPENLLSPEVFVVQNHGMGQWLSHYIARKKGVAANLKFEFPSERIWDLLRMMDPDIPEHLPSDRQPMAWSLMQLLENPQVLSNFDALAYYLEAEDSGQRQMRRWKLSSKIADVFDQYLIYRPDLILDWEERELHNPDDSTEEWQAELWNRLMEHWKRHDKGKWLHRAKLQQELLDRIRKGNFDESALPERLSVFGVSGMPIEFIRILAVLSDFIDICFYQMWTDQQEDGTEAHNPLLLSLGKLGANFRQQFDSVIDQTGCKVNRNYVPPAKSSRNTLHRILKSDLQQNQLPDAESIVPADPSVQVHSCHSPMREIEVLYDQLLDLLDRNPKLNPDKILIMSPDIETYAPIIEAVFDSPDEGQPSIPYSIDSGNNQAGHAVIDAFLAILDLAESRFKVTDTLDLIDSEPIRRAFSLNGNDMNRIGQWVRDGKIKWGIDGEFKKEMDLPDHRRFTWKSGLENMMAGYAMKPENDQLYGNIFPYDEIEGAEAAQRIGRLYRLLQSLFDINRLANSERSPQAWAKELATIPDLFFDSEDEIYYRQIFKIRKVIRQLADNASLGGYGGKVSFAIVRLWLREELERQSSGGGHIGRGVTFCSLDPMRSIPFEFVGMIGMNEGAFPRSKIPIEFDFMHLLPRAGDPLQSEEDRYLFLENILSAKQGLYFSYVGQHNRQDADFPPSVVLKEFMDYLQNFYGIEPKELLTEHRLQAFSRHYFDDNELFSYSRTQGAVSKKLAGPALENKSLFDTALPEADEEWKQLSVNDLISFFQHPPKYVMQNRLGISFRDEDVITDDREPFSLSKLDEHLIGQELLDRFLKGQSLDQYRAVMDARNALPEGWTGEEAYRQKTEEVQRFGKEIQQQLDEQQLPDQTVDLKIGEFRLFGNLDNIYKGARMDYRFGKARGKDKIEWWIRHLLLQQAKPSGHSGRSRLYSWKDSTFEEHYLDPVDESELLLEQLLELYWQGLQTPLPFYSKSSHSYAKKVLKERKEEKKALASAQRKWEPSSYGDNYYPGEGDDPYNKLAGGDRLFANPDFARISCEFWAPFFEALNKEGR